MRFRNDIHKRRFKKEIKTMDKKDNTQMVIVFLLTANLALSKMLGYTKEYCSKIFSEVVGMSFRDYLNFLRLKKAKEYLALKKSTKQTTTEIIYKCGFNSTATFYRALKGLRSKNINI